MFENMKKIIKKLNSKFMLLVKIMLLGKIKDKTILFVKKVKAFLNFISEIISEAVSL